jgi:hypothetical protein
MVGLAAVCLNGVAVEGASSGQTILAVFPAVAAQLARAVQVIIEDYFLHDADISPYLISEMDRFSLPTAFIPTRMRQQKLMLGRASACRKADGGHGGKGRAHASARTGSGGGNARDSGKRHLRLHGGRLMVRAHECRGGKRRGRLRAGNLSVRIQG